MDKTFKMGTKKLNLKFGICKIVVEHFFGSLNKSIRNS